MTDCPNPNDDHLEGEFPDGTAAENRVEKVSSLCSYGMRPHVMTGFLRQLLIGHFSDPQNIEDPKVRRHVKEIGGWKSTDSGLNPGGILIEVLLGGPRTLPTNDQLS